MGSRWMTSAIREGPDKSDLPDILQRWKERDGEAESQRKRTDKSFLVPKAEIAANDYDLSINRYKIETRKSHIMTPKVILERLAKLEEEITEGQENVGDINRMNNIQHISFLEVLKDVSAGNTKPNTKIFLSQENIQ